MKKTQMKVLLGVAVIGALLTFAPRASATSLTGQTVGGEVSPGKIDTQKLAADSVTAAAIMNGSIGSAALLTGAVDTGRLGKDAVNSAAILNAAVTTTKLAASAVDTGKIAGGSIDTSKLLGMPSSVSNGAVLCAKPDGNKSIGVCSTTPTNGVCTCQ